MFTTCTTTHFHTVNVGLAVGLSAGAFLLICVATPICVLIIVFYVARKRNRPVQTCIVATTPATGAATVVTSNQARTDPQQLASIQKSFITIHLLSTQNSTLPSHMFVDKLLPHNSYVQVLFKDIHVVLQWLTHCVLRM